MPDRSGVLLDPGGNELCSSRSGRSPGRRLGCGLVPIRCLPELAVDAFAPATWEKVQSRESLSQYLLDEDSSDYAFSPQVDIRLGGWVRCDSLRSLEVVVVVAAASAQRQCHGQPGSSPPRPPHTLLIVE